MGKISMCSVWEVIDLTFESEFEGNPFTEVAFSAVVTDVTTNYEKTIQGFYNGDKTFVLRMSFDRAGTYHYVTASTCEGLTGQTGTIEVKACEDLYRKGPIMCDSKNSKRLYYQDGSHYNLCAFECDWLFAVSYDDKKAMTKTKRLAEEICAHGFNHVVMNVYAYDLQWERDEWQKDSRVLPEHDHSGRKDIFPFLGNNETPDFTGLNVDFFKHLDQVIGILDENNLIAHLMIYVWNKKVNWPEANSVADNMYFEYVVKRYQAYTNIMWDISKEALGYGHCDMDYIVERIERLQALNTYKRLVTVHDMSFCGKYPELVDVISTQTWVLDIHTRMRETAERYPDKVVFNIEHGGYEEGPYQIFTGNYVDAKTCLRRNYEIVFAGVYSSYYWQPISWSVTMMPWESETYPKMVYYKYMTELFETYDFGKLIPDDTIGHGGYSLRNQDESLLMMYIPKENYAVTVAGMKRFEGKRCTYRFFDTVTGIYSETYERDLLIHNQFKSPFKEDTVLIIEIKGKNVL